jgi:hypothetical protein
VVRGFAIILLWASIGRAEVSRSTSAGELRCRARDLIKHSPALSPTSDRFATSRKLKTAVGHARGRSNRGLFVTPGPVPSLTKLIAPPYGGFWPLNFLENEVCGMLLAEDHGGPRVMNAGAMRGEGPIRYVEMEYIFYDRPSATLKGLVERERRRPKSARMPVPARPTAAHVDRMVDLLVETLERGVRVRDADFIFADEDRVRWLDGSSWSVEKKDLLARPGDRRLWPITPLWESAAVLSALRMLDVHLGRRALARFDERLRLSPRWSAPYRAAVFARLLHLLRTEWNWPTAD